jgi:hypothetical protein
MDIASKFWSKTKTSTEHEWGGTPCIDWTASRNPQGYGRFYLDGRKHQAHRVAYQLTHGDIPEGDGYHGTCVLHRCDRPCCVNPDHLFLGTPQDNMDDKVAKGRHTRGSSHNKTTLVEQDVILIKQFLQRHPPVMGRHGGPCTFLSRWFGVTKQIVSKIGRGSSWSHITTEGASS